MRPWKQYSGILRVLPEPKNRRIYTSFSLKETEAVMEEIING